MVKEEEIKLITWEEFCNNLKGQISIFGDCHLLLEARKGRIRIKGIATTDDSLAFLLEQSPNPLTG